jgi:hypothetical protein
MRKLRPIVSARPLALLAIAVPLLGAAPPTPPPETESGWEQYALLQLVAWDGQLFAYGFVETQEQELLGGQRGGGRAFLTPGPVGGYFDPNLATEFLLQPDPNADEAHFNLSTWSDWLDDPGTGPVVPFDPGSGVTDKSSFYEYECDEGCTWLAGPLSSDGRVTFRVVEGDVVVHNVLRSPAIGFTSEGDEQTHYVIAQSGAWVEDWIYVDGPGETATVEITATIQGSVDEPVAPPDFVAGIYGDLTTSDPGELAVPIGVGRARIRNGASLYSELQIGVAGTFPAVVDFQKTVTLEWDVDTPSWNTETRGSYDGDELVAVSREVPTGEWLRVYASLDGHSWCSGALACDLETNVELQVTSISAIGGEVRSANGIAGTIAVPEPSGSGLGLVALVALALRRAASPR